MGAFGPLGGAASSKGYHCEHLSMLICTPSLRASLQLEGNSTALRATSGYGSISSRREYLTFVCGAVLASWQG